MKTFLFIALSIAGSLSFAKNHTQFGVLEYKVSQATYASEHIQNAGLAVLKLDYNQRLVSLKIERRFHCPEGRVCAMVMPPPLIVELPIVSVTKDSCGIRTVTAKKDYRPVDGALELITIIDPSQMTCETFAVVHHEATYTTSYFDHFKSQNVVSESKMILSLKNVTQPGVEEPLFETSMAPPVLIKYVQNSGFSPRPSIRTMFIDVTGRVIEHVQDLRSQKSTVTEVAQLSSASLQNLKKKMATIPADSKMIDENDGEPRCTDAPSSTLSIRIENQDKPIYRTEGCHKHSVHEGEVERLFDIIMAFISLTY